MDIPYIIFILLLLLLSGLYWKTPKRIYFMFAIWIVLIFIGFRSRVVGGADSVNYVRFFTGEQNFYNINDTRDLEPLLMAYNAVLRAFLLSNGTLYLFATTFFGLFFIYKMIDRYSYNKMLSVLFFFFFLDYSLFFYALRQMLGISIYLGGLLFLLNNENSKYKWLVYGACCVCGYFMHTSVFMYAVVITLLYFMPLKRKHYLYVAVLGSAMLGIVFKQLNFMDFFNIYINFGGISATERLDSYLYWNDIRDTTSISLLLRPTVLSLIAVYFMDNEKVNHVFTKICIFSVVVGNIFYDVPMIHRFMMGFSFYIIVVITWILGAKYRDSLKRRKIVKLILFIIVIYFTRSYMIASSDYDKSSVTKMHPYYFFYEKK